MKKIDVKDKLEALDVTLDDVMLGDFDFIGEFTAKKCRGRDDENYRRFGAFFRPNYERGILIYYLIRQLKLKSVLEIGFGRGYAALCAAKAFDDAGIDGQVTSVDPFVDNKVVEMLSAAFPARWLQRVKLIGGKSADVVPTLTEKYDLIYIDGDHSAEGTRLDWEMTRDKFNKVVLFDDYHLASKNDAGIQCRKAIDEIDEAAFGCLEKELIITDRRMFHDDRGLTFDQVDYGQVLLTKES